MEEASFQGLSWGKAGTQLWPHSQEQAWQVEDDPRGSGSHTTVCSRWRGDARLSIGCLQSHPDSLNNPAPEPHVQAS